MYVAMTGAKQIMQAQAVNNNNIANANTTFAARAAGRVRSVEGATRVPEGLARVGVDLK